MKGTIAGPVYEVVWPLGNSASDSLKFSPRVDDLDGKTVCELNDFAWGEYFPQLRGHLKRTHPNIKIIEYPVFGATHGRDEREVIDRLPALLKEVGADAVISGVGL